MTRNHVKIDPILARSKYIYDPVTGIIRHRKRTSHRVREDLLAGVITQNVRGATRRVFWLGRNVPASRMAWVIYYGEDPIWQILFKDGDQLNCSIKNLIMATQSEVNMTKLAKINSLSGLKGVSWSKKVNAWESRIRVRGRNLFLGFYEAPESAHKAYMKAAMANFGQFARSGERA